MRAHILTIAAAVLCAAPAPAEPARAPAQKPDQAAGQPVLLIAAATEIPQVQQVQQQAQQQSNSASPAKPARHARVTTCRCGDQNPSE